MNSDNSNRDVRSTGEQNAERPHDTFQTRGDMTFKAAMEAEERERLEAHQRAQERERLIRQRLAEIDRRLAEIEREKEQIKQNATNPENDAAQPPADTEPRQPATTPISPTPNASSFSEAQGDSFTINPEQGTARPSEQGPVEPSGNEPSQEAGQTPNQGPTQVPRPESRQAPEHETDNLARRENIERISKKAKHNSGFKKVAQKIALIAMAGLIAIGIGSNLFGNHKNEQTKPAEQPQVTASTVVDQDRQDYQGESQGPQGENQESENGIYDGYGEKGMWLSKNKAGKYNFAAAKEVAEVCGDDECEMMKYAEHNQVGTFADHLANVPDAVKDKYGIPASFKGISIVETENKLEGLSKEDFTELQSKFDKLIDDAMTSQVLINGKCDNAFMRLKDPSGPVTHQNMELVRCTTTERDTLATDFTWYNEDGSVIGSMTVKFTPDGGCMQVINEVGSPVYKEMTTISPSENTPTPPYIPPQETPSHQETPEHKEEQQETEDEEKKDKSDIIRHDEEQQEEEQQDEEQPNPEIIKPKDPENLARIDDNIRQDIENNIHTDQLNIEKIEEADPNNITEQPSSDDFQGTEATIIQNETSQGATPIDQNNISQENDYSINRGGANAGNAAPNPVVEDNAAQEAADAAEIPVSEAPTSRQDISDTMADLNSTTRQVEPTAAPAAPAAETSTATQSAPAQSTTESTQSSSQSVTVESPSTQPTITPASSPASAPTEAPTINQAPSE